MIKLFNIQDYKINTSDFDHLLHGSIVSKVEELISNYVGAKYACSLNSATNAIFLSLLNKNIKVEIPSIIPSVVLNAILLSGNSIDFTDNIKWVGNSYILHDFGEYKIIDSAQKLEKNQFKREANSQDLMIFSFYPTKPIGSCDGGMIVSSDKEKIKWFKEMSFNGMEFNKNSWNRKTKQVGYKMYMNSIQAYFVKQNFCRLEKKYKKLKKIRQIYNDEFELNNSSNHLYRINVKNRKKIIKKFKKKEILYGIHYIAQHLNPLYNKEKYYLPYSKIDSSTTLSIPFHEELTYEEIETVIREIKK